MDSKILDAPLSKKCKSTEHQPCADLNRKWATSSLWDTRKQMSDYVITCAKRQHNALHIQDGCHHEDKVTPERCPQCIFHVTWGVSRGSLRKKKKNILQLSENKPDTYNQTYHFSNLKTVRTLKAKHRNGSLCLNVYKFRRLIMQIQCLCINAC